MLGQSGQLTNPLWQADCSSPLQEKKKTRLSANDHFMQVWFFWLTRKYFTGLDSWSSCNKSEAENYLSFDLLALHVKIFIQRQLTCRELLDGHRWYWYTLRPIGYLRLGEFSSRRCGPFTLEFFLSNCLLSCSLFLLFNLFTGKTI